MPKFQKAELKIVEPYDISFVEIRPGQNWKETIQRVATAIDVQFTSSSKPLPFVPFKEFQKLLQEEKVFLVGPSGCGKSRTIIELLRNKESSNNGRIFVINQSNPAGLDSGRENIYFLSQQFNSNDIVIWDNFPNGLIKRDLPSAFEALEIINSSPVQNLFISLKPTYLEMYRDLTLGIPDLYTYEITNSLETMKLLLQTYGKSVEQFKGIFEKYVSTNTDRIARILWQKQPLSLTVVDYYKALVTKIQACQGAFDESKALILAQEWLPAYDYFERQFEVMKKIEERRADVDFLCILRFCYEVGLDRMPSLIAKLQKDIFGSSAPLEPTQKLGTWVYPSGQNYAMHDSAKNAVKLTDHANMKMTSYLVDHFLEIVPDSDAQLHSTGLFLGKNIQFVPNDREGIIPGHIYTFMKKKAVFERAFGHGVGEEFERLDDALQEPILHYVDTEIEFGVGLADSLGERFVELDDNNRNRVLEKIYQGMLFARYFGQSVGRLYGRLSESLRFLIISHSEKNPQFADGLGMGIGYVFTQLEPELQLEIKRKAKKSFEISRGLGFGFGLTFGLLHPNDTEGIVVMADRNAELDTGFGMGLAASYSSLSDKLRNFVLGRAAKDSEFAFGVGIHGAFSYRDSCPKEIITLLHNNTEIASGLGLGFGASFFYLPEQFQSELELLLRNNVKLDNGLGTGIGFVLKHIPIELQQTFFNKASVNNAFAAGLGYGFGFTWQYIGDALKEKVIEYSNSNNELAWGLGIGLGSHLDYLIHMSPQILSLAEKNSELDRGIGAGAAMAWPYFSDDVKHIVIVRMKDHGEFAKGIGFGLARISCHFPIDEKEWGSINLMDDPSFLEGFGEGIVNFLWSTYDNNEKDQFLELASKYPEKARGLGIGVGFLHYFFKDEPGYTFKQLLNTDPNFKIGLGAGIGKAFVYLSEEARSEAFHMAEGDVDFSIGLGEGIGAIFSFLESSQKELVMSYAVKGTGFSRGFGKGLGLMFSYFPDDMKNKILGHAAQNEQFSRGLGAGIGARISYLSETVAIKIFEVARTNRLLAVGLGEGCGIAFPRLPQVTKDWLSSQAGISGFAIGLGIGMGKMKIHIDDVSIDQAANIAKEEEGFSEGFALGLGSVAVRLDKDEFSNTLYRAKQDRHFGSNFAFGLGGIFSILSDDRRKDVLEALKGNTDGLRNLGESIGQCLPSVGSWFVEEIMLAADSVDLERGVAKGMAESFNYLNLAEGLGVLQYTSLHPEYGEVLGEGLAERFATFDEDKQTMILDAIRTDNDFSKAFAKTITKSLIYVSQKTRERINNMIAQFPHLSIDLDKR